MQLRSFLPEVGLNSLLQNDPKDEALEATWDIMGYHGISWDIIGYHGIMCEYVGFMGFWGVVAIYGIVWDCGHFSKVAG